jgi:molybdopterin-binding protein
MTGLGRLPHASMGQIARFPWRSSQESPYSAPMPNDYRIGEAAKLLGVRVETLRRWERDGRLRARRTSGGQRVIPAQEVARLLAERRSSGSAPAHTSRRNAFPGVVTKVTKDKVSALVEIQAGPHRVVSLITREAADELGLRPGMEATATVKATSVMVEVS